MVACLRISETLSLDGQGSGGRLDSRDPDPRGPGSRRRPSQRPRGPGGSRGQPLAPDSAVTGQTPAEHRPNHRNRLFGSQLRGFCEDRLPTTWASAGLSRGREIRRFFQKEDGGPCSGRHLDVALEGLALRRLDERWTLVVLIPP